MITLETRVNGQLIGHIHVVNRSEIYSKKDIQIYSVECYRMDRKLSLLNFEVAHNPEEGFEKLSLIIYEKIDKILKTKKS